MVEHVLSLSGDYDSSSFFFEPPLGRRLAPESEMQTQTQQQGQNQQQQQGEGKTMFNHGQLMAGMWITRITGVISLISALFLISRAWKRRRKLFHRLILGMGIHLTIFGACNVIGAAAVPKSTNAIGNHGTIATCTGQGFLIYLSLQTMALYYCSFSVYGYVGTLNNFRRSTFHGMEAYIHVLLHLYPLGSGLYIVYLELFNNTGFGYCLMESDPINCGVDPTQAQNATHVPCERGESTHQQYLSAMLFMEVPLFVALFGPTAVMITLYCKVKNRQKRILIPARDVAKQSVYYLLVIYAALLPTVIVKTLDRYHSLTSIVATNLTLFANVVFTLCGLWIVLMYLYFSTICGGPIEHELECDGGDSGGESLKGSMSNFEHSNTFADNSGHIFSDHELEATTMTTTMQTTTRKAGGVEEETEPIAAAEVVLGGANSSSSTNSSTNTKSNSNSNSKTNKAKQLLSSRKRNSLSIKSNTNVTSSSSKQQSRKFSFNIFDGTNASGIYTDFVFDGDSDDERADHDETLKW
eukprot:CAMPEP_0168304932 /NCGR_PEP_ID=MMETSP0142_2-20121227/48626_1 /TAXON_ID=44445 /ORGANISM="Pseudo-nitzschia australis, Strain 10249 10 AB" /LENGTH=524 /DNA_ID=CAMNT_0008256287 /DNA_START=44 /DNA_END=1615 /DNA_ORIENTATION=-